MEVEEENAKVEKVLICTKAEEEVYVDEEKRFSSDAKE
jgi:hypothetical protein